MEYDPRDVIDAYERGAADEDEAESARSLRVELPREFVGRYLRPDDVVLDAGGGTGTNAALMARTCRRVTLLDLTPGILARAAENLAAAGASEKVELARGDITDLGRFPDGSFSFVLCVGDAISYVLDSRGKAISELVRVAREESIIILGCDSKLGFLRMKLAQGKLDEALAINESSECFCGMGPRTHLYTVSEMTGILESEDCEVLEVAATPSLADTFDAEQYAAPEDWTRLRALEFELCTTPELLGTGLHLLFVARKRRTSAATA